MTVTAVKERELPAADDEFAQLASEFDTLDELTADLRERLGAVRRMEQVDAGPRPCAGGDRRGHRGAAARDRRGRRGRAAASTTPCTPSTTTRSGSREFLAEQGKSARGVRRRRARRGRAQRARPGWCSTRSPTPRRSRSATRSSPSGSSSRPSSTRCRRRSSCGAIQEAGQLGAIYSDVRRSKALIAAVRRRDGHRRLRPSGRPVRPARAGGRRRGRDGPGGRGGRRRCGRGAVSDAQVVSADDAQRRQDAEDARTRPTHARRCSPRVVEGRDRPREPSYGPERTRRRTRTVDPIARVGSETTTQQS